MWVDMLVIPVGAPHPQAAHRFLDYLAGTRRHR